MGCSDGLDAFRSFFKQGRNSHLEAESNGWYFAVYYFSLPDAPIESAKESASACEAPIGGASVSPGNLDFLEVALSSSTCTAGLQVNVSFKHSVFIGVWKKKACPRARCPLNNAVSRATREHARELIRDQTLRRTCELRFGTPLYSIVQPKMAAQLKNLRWN